MYEEKMRKFEFGGKRRGINLDARTWNAVDWLAKQRGVKWGELAREWAEAGTSGPDKDENLTRVIRTAVINELLRETVFAERAEAMCGHQATGFRLAGMFYRQDDFEYAVKQATEIEGTQDLTTIEIATGADEFGRITFYIKNQLEGAPSMIISTPFTKAEWESRTEEE